LSNRKIPNQDAMHIIASYLGLKNKTWFGQAGSENACIFRMRKWCVAIQLYLSAIHIIRDILGGGGQCVTPIFLIHLDTLFIMVFESNV